MTTTTDLAADPSTRRRPPPGAVSPRWATAGIAAGVAAFVVFGGVSSGVLAPTDSLDDNAELVTHLTGAWGWVWAYQVGTFAIAVLVALFGLGLRRRLAAQSPATSLAPDMAAAGMLLVSALTLVGGGISTEMFAALRHLDDVDPDTVAAQLTLFNTLGWVWAGGVLTAAALAVAGLRHGAVSRRLGTFAAVITALIVLTQLVPLQYLAVAPVAVLLVGVGWTLRREADDEAPASMTTFQLR